MLHTTQGFVAVGPRRKFAIPVVNVLLAVHMLFAGFVMANLVYYGSIVVSYRRLANG